MLKNYLKIGVLKIKVSNADILNCYMTLGESLSISRLRPDI